MSGRKRRRTRRDAGIKDEFAGTPARALIANSIEDRLTSWRTVLDLATLMAVVRVQNARSRSVAERQDRGGGLVTSVLVEVLALLDLDLLAIFDGHAKVAVPIIFVLKEEDLTSPLVTVALELD